MRISDWSSDVCSSDLLEIRRSFTFKQDVAKAPDPSQKRGWGRCQCGRSSAFNRSGGIDDATRLRLCEKNVIRFHETSAGLVSPLRLAEASMSRDRKSTRLNSSH